ncbi:MAG: phytanoyl-CoA dioxygenase family protein [Planctomycetales bacterium]|nr:phytanoyl-CoA dioxygenase family protein [Planctomycetales bacterium]
MNTDYSHDAVARLGYAVVENVLNADDVAKLIDSFDDAPAHNAVRRKSAIYGVRNLLEINVAVREIACDERIRNLVAPMLGAGAFATRAILFDKVPGANWSLGWHQDSVISVREPSDVAGFRAWSQKAGVWQVQPPAEVLGGMLTVRIHLDDCGESNGPLRVLPGSHRFGWLDDEIEDWKARVQQIVCTVSRGGVVLMNPILLHASSPAEYPAHRRVVHIEYACAELPGGLEWNQRVAPSND